MIYALILFAALQCADGYTTSRLLSAGGKELNPPMRWLLTHFGYGAALWVPKAIIAALAVAVSPWLPLWALTALCGVYAGVVYCNYLQMRA